MGAGQNRAKSLKTLTAQDFKVRNKLLQLREEARGVEGSAKDSGGKVRSTDDGRVSVYDAIGFTTGHKNPRDVWNDLLERDSVFVGKTDKYKFSGRGGAARPTPVATLQVFLEILTWWVGGAIVRPICLSR